MKLGEWKCGDIGLKNEGMKNRLWFGFAIENKLINVAVGIK